MHEPSARRHFHWTRMKLPPAICGQVFVHTDYAWERHWPCICCLAFKTLRFSCCVGFTSRPSMDDDEKYTWGWGSEARDFRGCYLPACLPTNTPATSCMPIDSPPRPVRVLAWQVSYLWNQTAFKFQLSYWFSFRRMKKVTNNGYYLVEPTLHGSLEYIFCKIILSYMHCM
jgi:hypothetical protein